MSSAEPLRRTHLQMLFCEASRYSSTTLHFHSLRFATCECSVLIPPRPCTVRIFCNIRFAGCGPRHNTHLSTS